MRIRDWSSDVCSSDLFLSGGVSNLLGYAKAGVDFIFGPLASPEIGGNSFAIAALPVIIFFASLVSILYYLGIMQLVVRWIGGGIEKVIGVSKVESLCAAANIFVGRSEEHTSELQSLMRNSYA